MMRKKIVIEIAEKYYTDIKESEHCGNYSVLYALDAIRNGIPLPKGHGRIIDESEITSIYYHEEKAEQGAINFRGTVIDGTDAPTIIEADKGE